MKEKCLYKICLTNHLALFLLIVYFSAFSASQRSSKPEFSSNFTRNGEVVYFSAFLEEVPWHEADVTCKLFFGYLLSDLPSNSALYDELVKKGVDVLWVGIHRKMDYFVQMREDSKNPFLFKEKRITSPAKSKEDTQIIGKRWADDEELLHDCVALNIKNATLTTQDCKLSLPFVCESNETLIENNKDCPTNWILSAPLSISGRKCVSQMNEAAPFWQAESHCFQEGGRLASKTEYSVMNSRKQLPKSIISEFWAQKAEKELCTYQSFESRLKLSAPPKDPFDPVFCSSLTPFLCVKEMETEGLKVNLEVGPSVNSVDPCQIFPWNSTCETKDMMICNVKNYSEKDILIHWFKDDIPVECFTYVCRMSFISSGFKWKIDGNDFRTKQGSYHCEVRIRGSAKSYPSRKIDFFYPDVATYVIDIHGIKTDADYVIDMTQVDYSRSEHYKNMKKIMKIIKSRIPTEKSGVWDFKSVRKIGDTYSLKLLLFINRTISFDEMKSYESIMRNFKNAELSQFGLNLSITVQSADVCFKNDLGNGESCENKITWATSKQAKNIPTEIACLNEQKKVVHRGCKASTVSKAEWTAFDCSECNNFLKRYHDQPINCPFGYDKLKKREVCFKVYHEKKNWNDAYKTCAESGSYLIDSLNAEDIDNIDNLWLSFKYSHGRIQGFGMKPISFDELRDHKDEITLDDIDKKSPGLYCVSAIKRGVDYKFKLRNCSSELHFVCVQKLYRFASSAKFASTWIKPNKQKNVESCYYFENSPFTWAETSDFCEQTFYNAKLLDGVQSILKYTYLKKLIVDQQFNGTECNAKTWWMNFDDVINNGMPSDLSYVDWGPSVDFSINEPHGVITLFPDKNVYWSLENAHRKLRVICEIKDCHDDRPTQAYIENRSLFKTNGSENILDWLLTNHFKCVPSGWFVTGSISWYKDDILLPVVSDEFSFHNIANVTYQNALDYQGYYSCSVDRIEDKISVHSSKYLLRIPGFYTFALSMTSFEKKYLDDCPKYMLSDLSYGDISLNECLTEHFEDFLLLNNSHFTLKKVICSSDHVDIIVHISFKEEALSEDEILERVQKSDFDSFCSVCNIDPKSVVVRSTASCKSEETLLNNMVLLWPTTDLGKSTFPVQLCLSDDGMLIERKCTGDFISGAVWSNLSITECKHANSEITKELFDIWISGDYIDSLSRLPNLTSNTEIMQPSDIQITVDILGYLSNMPFFPADKLYAVVNTISNMIDVSELVLSAAASYSNQVIGYFEKIASNIDEEYEDKNISTKNVHVNIYSLNNNKREVPNCIFYVNSSTSFIFNASSEDLQNNMQNFEAGIVLPNSLVQEKSNVSDRVIYSIFHNMNYQENVSVLSVVIGASLRNVAVYDLERKEVSLLFKVNKKLDENTKKLVRCVFWDDSLKSWSYKGCFLKNSTQDSVLCACNHLTSFTVIMMESIPQAHERPLKFITYIGCSLSCIGLGMIVLTFLWFREWRKSLKNKCLFNFSISYFLFLVIYMIGIDKTDSRAWCKMTAIFLHYFLLSSFAWMIILAYTVYLSLVKVFATYIPRMIQKAMAFAWGLPIIIVAIIVSYNHNYYPGGKLCWLSPAAFIYGIMIPLIVMLVINYVIFGTILYLNTCGSKYVACNQQKRKLLITRAKALLCTSILLGLSWIFGFFAMGTTHNSQIFFMYLFNFTTTFQGFLLAVFFILRPKPTRQLWMKLLISPTTNSKSHASHSTAVTTHDHNRITSKYENVMYGVVFKARTPYSPYA